jgi:hypothetical protein
MKKKGNKQWIQKKNKMLKQLGKWILKKNFMCALRKIKNLRKKNLKKKEQLQKYEEEDHVIQNQNVRNP